MNNSNISNPKPLNYSKDSYSEIKSVLGSKARFSKITTDSSFGVSEQITACMVNPSSTKANIVALLKKRFHIYKRDKVGLICEIIVPFIMVLIGCSFQTVNIISDSPDR